MIGNTTPPVAEPAAVIQIASARLLEKYVETRAMVGQNIHPFPMPIHTPCERNSCTYVVQRDVMKIPISWSVVPMRNRSRKWPASVRRPLNVPMKKRRKTWIDPTQEMSEGGRWSVET